MVVVIENRFVEDEFRFVIKFCVEDDVFVWLLVGWLVLLVNLLVDEDDEELEEGVRVMYFVYVLVVVDW